MKRFSLQRDLLVDWHFECCPYSEKFSFLSSWLILVLTKHFVQCMEDVEVGSLYSAIIIWLTNCHFRWGNQLPGVSAQPGVVSPGLCWQWGLLLLQLSPVPAWPPWPRKLLPLQLRGYNLTSLRLTDKSEHWRTGRLGRHLYLINRLAKLK